MEERIEKRARMLEKVRKLLAMARDGRGNEHEEQIAMRQANRLMAEYGIAEAEADMAAIDRGEMVFGTVQCGPDGRAPEQGRVYRSMPSYAGILSIGVARFTDSVVVRKRNEFGELLVFQGEKEDVLLARWLFGVLVESILREQRKSGWTARGDANSFRSAAAGTLQTRLCNLARERSVIMQEAKAQSNSRALVVVDRKQAIIAERFGAQRTSTRRSSVCASGAYYAGKTAGASINIPSGRPIAGANNHRLT